MSKRTSYLALGGALGCLLLFLCLGVAALAAFAYSSSTLALADQTIDRIAYVDNDMNIQVVDAKGEHRVSLTNDAAADNLYMYPTFSLDSQHVGFVSAHGTRDHHEGSLHVALVTGGDVRTVYKSDSEFPFYIYWSPNNQQIGFLAQSANEMSLLLGQIDGRDQPRKVGTGAPMYWAWSPDGHTILLHVGQSSQGSQDAQLSLIQDGQQPQKISDSPAAFQAPQFSPDGKAILYASTRDANQDALYLASAQGGSPNAIVTYTGAIAFSWSPDGAKIASLVTPENADLPVQGPIFVSDASGQNRKAVTTEDAIAFYWSPDSKQIAYLTLVEPGQNSSSAADYLRVALQRVTRAGRTARSGGLSAPLPQTADIQMRWRIMNLADGSVRTLATFSPTDHFISLLPFFDQYARSATFWSPDSQHLVYTQQEGQDGGSIWVVDTAQGSTPRKIGDGTLAVWSWK